MKKVKFGILSTANIGLNALVPGIQKSQFGDLYAIASRSIQKAKTAAEDKNIPVYYGNYDELLEDNQVDAIYIPLPNHLHVDWTIKALEAGKHVLCEKPFALNEIDGKRLLPALENNPDLKFMEAFMYKFHPQWQQVKSLIQSGEIGDIIDVKSTFSYDNPDPNNIRNKYKNGGGGILDVGCYCINLSRLIYDETPVMLISDIEIDSEFGVDSYAKALIKFPSGHASFSVGTRTVTQQLAQIIGTDGMISIENPFFAAPLEKDLNIYLTRNGNTVTHLVTGANQYALMVDHFAESIINNSVPNITLNDSLNNMRVIDAVFNSYDQQNWIEI